MITEGITGESWKFAHANAYTALPNEFWTQKNPKFTVMQDWKDPNKSEYRHYLYNYGLEIYPAGPEGRGGVIGTTDIQNSHSDNGVLPRVNGMNTIYNLIYLSKSWSWRRRTQGKA